VNINCGSWEKIGYLILSRNKIKETLTQNKILRKNNQDNLILENLYRQVFAKVVFLVKEGTCAKQSSSIPTRLHYKLNY